MEIWLDTTDRSAIEEAQEAGLLFGITTNPSIVSNAGEPLEELLDDLLNRQQGPVAVQVTTHTAGDMIEQAKDLYDFSNRIIVKIPAIPEGLKAIANLSHIGIPTMATAILEPLQGFLAAQAGAAYAAPYFSHMGENRLDILRTLYALLSTYRSQTKLLVAALNSPDQVLACVEIGVPALTLKAQLFLDCCKPPAQTLKHLTKFDTDWLQAPPSKLLPVKALR